MDQGTTRAPVSFWIVSSLGLLWNAMGALDYTMTRLRNREWISRAGDPQQVLDWIGSFPLWAQIGWGLGVWGSIAGSLLMLMRSRHAASAFVVSLIGALASFGYQFGHPPASGTTGSRIVAVMIMLVIVLLWQYCQRAIARGLLR